MERPEEVQRFASQPGPVHMECVGPPFAIEVVNQQRGLTVPRTAQHPIGQSKNIEDIHPERIGHASDINIGLKQAPSQLQRRAQIAVQACTNGDLAHVNVAGPIYRRCPLFPLAERTIGEENRQRQTDD